MTAARGCEPFGVNRVSERRRTVFRHGTFLLHKCSSIARTSPENRTRSGEISSKTVVAIEFLPDLVSVAAEHERLDRIQQRLNPQDHGVHERNGIHGVESETPRGAQIA